MLDLGADKLFPSSDGFDRIEDHLIRLYGSRGSYAYNIARYLSSAEYANECHHPQTLEDVPEITLENLKYLADCDRHFKERASRLASTFESMRAAHTMTDEAYEELAGLLGIVPSPCDRMETMFPHLVDPNVSSEDEAREIFARISARHNLLNLCVDLLMDGLTDGQVLRDYDGRWYVSQGYARCLYRGENAYNAHCSASIYRGLPAGEEGRAELELRQLRMCEFLLWIASIEEIGGWPYGDVAHGALAQHYGVPTNGVDVTGDFRTALFFACCTWEDGTWRPLRPEEYERSDSRPDVAKRGGDSRFGMLFKMPLDVSRMSACVPEGSRRLTQVIPVGYQPLMRCSSQNAYLIGAGQEYDMYGDGSFAKARFRLSPEVCEWAYEGMEGGRGVYPSELVGPLDDIVGALRGRWEFSLEALKLLARHLGRDERELRSSLEGHGVRFVSQVRLCSEARERQISETFLEKYPKSIYAQMVVKVRPCFLI